MFLAELRCAADQGQTSALSSSLSHACAYTMYLTLCGVQAGARRGVLEPVFRFTTACPGDAVLNQAVAALHGYCSFNELLRNAPALVSPTLARVCYSASSSFIIILLRHISFIA